MRPEHQIFVTEGEGSVEMDTSSQPKKLLYRESKLKQKQMSVCEAIEQNKWNPFERVNPAVLEKLHRKLTKSKQLLDEYEESPI